MISKSYIAENDNDFFVKNSSILFYGENLGLKNYFKRKIKFLNKNYQFINLVQDDLMQNQNLIFNEINNASLFEDKNQNLWLGLDNGVDCVNVNSPFLEYNDDIGKIGAVYASAKSENYFYLGTNH